MFNFLYYKLKCRLLIYNLISNINYYWYIKKIPLYLYILYPCEIFYLIYIYIRKLLYKYKILKTYNFHLPIIVVGNITVGGTGKTPMVAYLANYLQLQGFKVAVIMRGYGAQYFKDHHVLSNKNKLCLINRHLLSNKKKLSLVKRHFSPIVYGDEPVMLANKLNCPIVIGRNRVKSVEYLLDNYKLDLIISDDGLQHYALGRDVEIIMLDGDRYFGNGHLLPLGPLRTKIIDLKNVNFIMLNNSNCMLYKKPNACSHLSISNDKLYSIQLVPNQFYNLLNPNLVKNANYFKQVHAVAGIGNNQKFFNLLNSLNIATINHSFPDHYKYTAKDLNFNDNLPIIMTEKDAVKCLHFATDIYWQLKVELQIQEEEKFQQHLLKCLHTNFTFSK